MTEAYVIIRITLLCYIIILTREMTCQDSRRQCDAFLGIKHGSRLAHTQHACFPSPAAEHSMKRHSKIPRSYATSIEMQILLREAWRKYDNGNQDLVILVSNG